MSRRPHDPILLGVALTLGAIVLAAQSFVYRLVPPDDARATALVATGVRIAFFAADVLVLAALARLLRSSPVRAWAAACAGLSGFVVLSGFVGIGAHLGGTTSRSTVASVMSAAESGASLFLPIALLVLLVAIARVVRLGHAWVFAVIALVPFLLAVGAKTARAADPSSRTMTEAWIAWALEVARPLALAAFAFVLARASRRRPDSERSPEAAPGPYRGPASGAPARLVRPDVASLPEWRAARTGIGVARVGVVLRLVSAVLVSLLAIALEAVRGRDFAVLLLAVPLGTIATTLAVVVGVLRALLLVRIAGGRGRVVAAMVVLGLGVFADFGMIAYSLDAITEHSWSAYRRIRDALPLEYAATTFTGGVALYLLAGALRKAGEGLRDATLEGRARSAQALALAGAGALATSLGAFFAVTSRADDAVAPLLVAGALFLATLGIALASAIAYVRALGAAGAALDASIAAAAPRAP